MFSSLKSLLSNTAAPGSAIVTASPFSLFARITVSAHAGESIDPKQLEAELRAAEDVLFTDNLVDGRDQVRAIRARLFP
jgi:hypothetical protein